MWSVSNSSGFMFYNNYSYKMCHEQLIIVTIFMESKLLYIFLHKLNFMSDLLSLSVFQVTETVKMTVAKVLLLITGLPPLVFQSSEEPRLLLLLPQRTAAATVWPLRQDQVHDEDW